MAPTRPFRLVASGVTFALTLVGSLAVPSARAAVPRGVNDQIVYSSQVAFQPSLFRVGQIPPLYGDLAGAAYAPSVSPDARRLVFTLDPGGGTTQIEVIDLDGTHQAALTTSAEAKYNPTFTPDGSRIVFQQNRPSGMQIMVMRTDGSDPIQLTYAGDNAYPEVSPDGRTIMFASDRDGGSYQLYTMDLDGGHQTRISTSTGFDGSPAYSPDGTRIAFVSNRSGTFNIWTANADGSSPTRIASAFNDYMPAWSPDGTKIVFSSDRDGDGRALFTMTPAGATVTRVSPSHGSSVGYDDDATWVPQVVSCQGLAATVRGTPGPDTIAGTPGDDVIAAGAGNDTIDGGGGADVICGGDGTDTVTYGPHQSDVRADLTGGTGDDGSSEDGPAGARDSVGTDVENLVGGHGDDVLVGSSTPNALNGGPGDDLLRGGEGNDALTGGTGDDTVRGGDGNDTLTGSSGDDVLKGSDGTDTVNGLTGDDTLAGGEGNDTLDGGADGDVVRGGPGADKLSGSAGLDDLQARDATADLLIDCGADTDTVSTDSADPATVGCP